MEGTRHEVSLRELVQIWETAFVPCANDIFMGKFGVGSLRIWIFSNIYHYDDDSSFIEDITRVVRGRNNVFVFLNRSVPFVHASSFFIRKGLVLFIHRIDMRTGKVYGREQIDRFYKENKIRIKRNSFFLNDRLELMAEGDREISDGIVAGGGVGRIVEKAILPELGNKDIPTTGYFAARYFELLYGIKNIVLVNFFGSKDRTTKKWRGHPWSFEEMQLVRFEKIFLSPLCPDIRSADKMHLI